MCAERENSMNPFDFNGDGKTSLGEQFVEFQIFNKVMGRSDKQKEEDIYSHADEDSEE